MLKPYLDSMSSAAPKTGPNVTDEDRIQSIKQHFATLTGLTAQDLTSDTATKNQVENNSDPKTGQQVTDEDRIQSIKQHFEKLTASTAQDTATKNQVESSEDESSDNNEEATIDDYDPDPGDVKKLREGLEKSKKNKVNKKRGSGSKLDPNNPDSAKKAKVDMENVDMSQYSSGVKKDAKPFDPMKEFRDGAGKKKNFGKPKQRSKNKTGKSMTYKN